MNVLLTGPFGNVGVSTLKELLLKNHKIICFDLMTSNNEEQCKKLQKKGDFEIIWGDITNPDDVNNLMKDIDVIIHLAGIIPPLSEKKPKLAYKVNVGGTQNLINAAEKLEKPPRFILASSVSIYGPCMHKKGLRRADDDVCPTDNYTHTKVDAEKLVKESNLPWLILRLAAVSIPKIPLKLDPIVYEIPLEQRIEFITSQDTGRAFANAVDVNALNKVLLIGGGKECQIYQRDFVGGYFDALGIPMLPDIAFKMPKNHEDWFYTDWMETKESQELLDFQRTSFKEYIENFKKKMGARRFGLKMVAPFAKLGLLMMSPYYKFTNENSIRLDRDYYKYLKSTIKENNKTINTLSYKIENLESKLKEINSLVY